MDNPDIPQASSKPVVVKENKKDTQKEKLKSALFSGIGGGDQKN